MAISTSKSVIVSFAAVVVRDRVSRSLGHVHRKQKYRKTVSSASNWPYSLQSSIVIITITITLIIIIMMT